MPIAIDGDGTITGVSVGGLPDAIVDTDMLAASAVTEAKLATDPQQGIAKVWINFNGTGTIAIRDSFNVASITDNGTGDYTVTYSNAMADTNYAVVLTATDVTTGGSNSRIVASPRTKAAGSQRISCNGVGSSDHFDCVEVNLVVFGD